jgi:sugar/nucleoside kinase (ribokinase family)
MAPPSAPTRSPGSILCLGEAMVDLISERPIESLTAADSFVPHFGGATANVAVMAARAGAPVTLAGGAGDDEWGRWLRDRLVQENVDVSRFELLADLRTVVSLVAIDEQREAHHELYGDAFGTVVPALGDRVDRAVEEAGALLISSSTLADPEERAVTMQARDVALELGRPVVFDANLRPHRWRSRADAAASANACVPRALLVTVSASEAAWMSGEDDPEAAATALLKAGARLVVVTLGADGAILRGELRANVPGVQAQVLSTVGAGDTVTAALVARLTGSDFYTPSVAAGLGDAVAEAARSCERWGAID